MRLSAYILVADPAHIELSVSSFYGFVTEIVVSYDKDGIGWNGSKVPIAECLERLRAIDPEKKLRYVPGTYYRPGQTMIQMETAQRTEALVEAGKTGDWVLQLDTDEVVMSSSELIACIKEADEKGFNALHYPSRVLHKQIDGNRYLELCGRLWGPRASYPGPIAVKKGTKLVLNRQCEGKVYRVDFSFKNTDPGHPRDAHIDRTIDEDQAVMHFNWVRSEESMMRKATTSAHAGDFDWTAQLNDWLWAGRHPYLAFVRTPFMRGSGRGRLRITNWEPQKYQHAPTETKACSALV